MRFFGFEQLRFGCIELTAHRSCPFGVCDHCGDLWKNNYELDCGHYICEGCLVECEDRSWCGKCRSWSKVTASFSHDEEVIKRQRAVCGCGTVLLLQDMKTHISTCRELVSSTGQCHGSQLDLPSLPLNSPPSASTGSHTLEPNQSATTVSADERVHLEMSKAELKQQQDNMYNEQRVKLDTAIDQLNSIVSEAGARLDTFQNTSYKVLARLTTNQPNYTTSAEPQDSMSLDPNTVSTSILCFTNSKKFVCEYKRRLSAKEAFLKHQGVAQVFQCGSYTWSVQLYLTRAPERDQVFYASDLGVLIKPITPAGVNGTHGILPIRKKISLTVISRSGCRDVEKRILTYENGRFSSPSFSCPLIGLEYCTVLMELPTLEDFFNEYAPYDALYIRFECDDLEQ